MKDILIINGHPMRDSYSRALVNAYKQGAVESGFNVSVLELRNLKFNPILEFAYKKRMVQEADIEYSMAQIDRSDHLVWVFPMWWYGCPALVKGFIDRVFLPGFAFRSRAGKMHEKLLKGKTARIIITADTPRWYDFLIMRSPAINQLKRGVLQFSGIKPVRVTYISPIKNSSELFRQKGINKVMDLGRKGR